MGNPNTDLRTEFAIESENFQRQSARLNEMADYLHSLNNSPKHNQHEMINDIEWLIEDGLSCHLWDLFALTTMPWTDNTIVEDMFIANFDLQDTKLCFEYMCHGKAYYTATSESGQVLVEITNGKLMHRQTTISKDGLFDIDCEEVVIWIDGLVQLCANGVDTVLTDHDEVMGFIQQEVAA